MARRGPVLVVWGSRALAACYATSVPSAGRCSHSHASVFPCLEERKRGKFAS